MDISGTIVKFPLFKDYESKEKFFTVLGMLYSRQITLSKASELLDMDRDEFSMILKNMNLEYSYLTEGEAKKELKSAKILIEKLKWFTNDWLLRIFGLKKIYFIRLWGDNNFEANAGFYSKLPIEFRD